MAPCDHLLYSFPFPFKDRLHLSIHPVLHPSEDVEAIGLLLSTITEKNPLYPPLYDNPYPYFLSLLTLVHSANPTSTSEIGSVGLG